MQGTKRPLPCVALCAATIGQLFRQFLDDRKKSRRKHKHVTAVVHDSVNVYVGIVDAQNTKNIAHSGKRLAQFFLKFFFVI